MCLFYSGSSLVLVLTPIKIVADTTSLYFCWSVVTHTHTHNCACVRACVCKCVYV